ncbi:MAG: CRISPR-associated protein Cas6, partial [Nitrospirae bacterium CG02_land_8_20_14_3_00_41_53]
MECKQFNFNITAKEPLILPAYKGSTFRGGFGYAFKRVVCAIKDKECP